MKSFIALAAIVATVSLDSSDAFVPQSLLKQSFVGKTNADPSVRAPIALRATVENNYLDNLNTGSKSVASAPRIAQRWRKSTKQLATLGPASESREMLEKLFLAGADVFRLNFSHGSQEQNKELLDTIRSVEEQYSHPIAALGDLQGPKLRVSDPVTFLILQFIHVFSHHISHCYHRT